MSAPLNPPPPPGGNQDRGSSLISMFWTECALALILVGLRFYARISMRNLGADDWMMLLTVFLFLVMTCFVTYLASIGGARHVYYLSREETLEAVKWSWISQPWGIFLFATGKASVAILVLRIMGPNTLWQRWILYSVIATVFIVNSLGCIFTFVQCNPPRALWTPGISARCWNSNVQAHFNYFLAAWNIFLDIVLALLPITIFWNLKMKLSKRIALCCLLGLGIIAALFSGIKVMYLVDLTARSDFTWSAYDIEAWTGAEAFIMIVCGNIPPLKPLWDRFVTHKLDSSYGRTPLAYNMSSYASKGSESLKKTPVMGHSTRILSSEHDNWSRDDGRAHETRELRIKAVTDIDVQSIRSMV